MQPHERRAKLVEPVKSFEISEAHVAVSADGRARRLRRASEALIDAAKAPGMKLPLLPETAGEALRLANDPKTAMNRLERVVARDGVLAARVLMVAGSSAYTGGRVRSVGAALAVLGTGAVRDVLYQAVLECHVFHGKHEAAARRERDHAVVVGHLARVACRLIGFDQDQAFICGLLHDIGRVALGTLASHAALTELDATDAAAVLESAHAAVGAHLVVAWKLPALAVEAVRRHHVYAGFGPNGDGYSQIGHAVNVADRVAAHLGAGRPARALGDDDLAAMHALGIDPTALLGAADDALARAA